MLDRVLIKAIYILSSRRKSTLSFISSHYNFLLTFSMQTFKPINFKRCAMFNRSFKDYLQVIKSFVRHKKSQKFWCRIFMFSSILVLHFKRHKLQILCHHKVNVTNSIIELSIHQIIIGEINDQLQSNIK